MHSFARLCGLHQVESKYVGPVSSETLTLCTGRRAQGRKEQEGTFQVIPHGFRSRWIHSHGSISHP